MVVPFGPVMIVDPLTCRLKTPGSLAGTVTFFSSRVAVHRLDVLDAVTVLLPSFQVSVAVLPNGVWNAPICRPGWNSLGWPRSTGSGAKPLPLPGGIVTGKSAGFE